jgi:mono/diheme cytochrome c family protein
VKKTGTQSYRGPHVRAHSALAVGLLLIAGCAPESADDRDSASQAIDGAVVFAENCAVCHLSGRAPRLESIKALPQSERGDRIRNHPRAGNLVDRLTAATLLDLIDFLKTVPPDATEPEGPGSETFVAECGACHVAGRGPRFTELGRLSEQEFLGRMRAHPVAGAIPQRLTAVQIGALIEFFEAQ